MPDQPKIYVGGATVESLGVDTIEGRVYRALSEALKSQGLTHILPVRRQELQHLPPPNFYDVIDRTIQAADGIIIILSPGDGSSPGEAVIASLRRKPQVIMTLDEQVPRLLAGLPRVLDTVKINSDAVASQAAQAVAQLQHAIQSRTPPTPPFLV